MWDSRSQRWLGFAGLALIVLVVVLSALMGNSPDSHASASSVVSYYRAHRGAMIASVYVIAVAVVEGIFFFWYLRERLCETESARTLATVGFAGALVLAAGGAMDAGVDYELYDAVNHVSPTVMQTLNVVQNDLARLTEGPGVALFLIATGIAIVRTNVLPEWLGWIGAILGVVALVVMPVLSSVLVAYIWILIASIALLVLAGNRPAIPASSLTTNA